MDSIYQKVSIMYEKQKEENKKYHENTVKKIYEKCPRIKEIDNEISMLGISVIREVLNSNFSEEKAVSMLKDASEKLLKEKEALLNKMGLNSDCMKPVYKCNICKDKGYVNGKRCVCFSNLITKELMNSSNLAFNDNACFDNFNLDYYSSDINPDYKISPRKNAESILISAKKYVADCDNDANLLLYGNAGLGKTFTSECIAREFIKKQKSVFYISAPKMFSIYEDYKFGRNTTKAAKDMMDSIEKCNLLIIDDLGTEFHTAYIDSCLFDIINQRLTCKRKTIISTNLSAPEIMECYSERIASRIVGNFERILFFGDDIRIKKIMG